jgi:hypothetical protein
MEKVSRQNFFNNDCKFACHVNENVFR